MADIVLVAVGLGFFLIAALYVRACDAVVSSEPERLDEARSVDRPGDAR